MNESIGTTIFSFQTTFEKPLFLSFFAFLSFLKEIRLISINKIKKESSPNPYVGKSDFISWRHYTQAASYDSAIYEIKTILA